MEGMPLLVGAQVLTVEGAGIYIGSRGYVPTNFKLYLRRLSIRRTMHDMMSLGQWFATRQKQKRGCYFVEEDGA